MNLLKIFCLNFIKTIFLVSGGAPALPPGLPAQYYLGFRGCVASVKVDKRPLHLVRHGDNSVTHFCDAD
jgi:hypothetical protein